MSQGFDPDYLLDLDLPSFESLAESAQRTHTLERYNEAWRIALAFNDTKELAKQIKEARRKAGHATRDGTDLERQVGMGM